FIAIGTAVKGKGRTNWKTPAGTPFTSDLSGQDFWTLLQMGYRPVSLVLGNCVYHIAHRRMLQTLGSVGRNVELPNFTQALYTARELAMERMQAESRRDGATGVVGVRVEEKSHVWGHHAVEFLAIGTAVVKLRQRPATTKPKLILNLG
ncbi:MAG TPA: heavy metal-binding domain-containing protein, partial [Acidimicrobiales bacterium]|nr:heavy metal-binding domain-containing protein [Acidimicrobiales bacterium]